MSCVLLGEEITTVKELRVLHENCPHSSEWPPPKTMTTQGVVFQLSPRQHGNQLHMKTRGLSSVFGVGSDSIRFVRCYYKVLNKIPCLYLSQPLKITAMECKVIDGTALLRQ